MIVDYHPLQIITYDARYREQGVALAQEIHETSAYSDMPFQREKLLQQFEGPFCREPYFLRLAVRGDVLYGAFLGLTVRALFCDAYIAKDVGWWVVKSKRGSAAAIKLLRAFEAWAQSKGVHKIMVGQASAVDIARTTRLYKHCGYRVCGYNTVKELRYG